jgi:hypothetical protein
MPGGLASVAKQLDPRSDRPSTASPESWPASLATGPRLPPRRRWARQYERVVPIRASVTAWGAPRTEKDAARLDRFNRYMQLPIVVSAILPLIVVPQSGNLAGVLVGVVTWLVFLVDLVVHVRLTRGYLRTGFGIFDLIVVLLTSPWYLLPGVSAGGLVNVLRLARLARLLIATRGVRRLFAGLGRVAIVAGLLCWWGRRSRTVPSTRRIRDLPPSVTRCGGAS